MIYRISYRIFSTLLFGLVFSDQSIIANAQMPTKSFTAAQTFEVSGEIAEAYMLFSSEVGALGVVPATVLRMANRKNIIVAGSYRGEDTPGKMFVTGVVISKDGTMSSLTTALEEPGQEGLSSLNVRDLAARLESAKESLITLEKERQSKAGELERLQQDADTIANVGRIVDAEDELGAVKGDEQRLAASVAAAKAQLAVLKSQGAPTNYQRREAELSAFLTEYARASRDSESEVFKRLENAETEAAKNLALIEESRFEHVDLLQKELISLRKEREAVERSRQVIVADRADDQAVRIRPPELTKELPTGDESSNSDESSEESESAPHGTGGE